MSFLKSAGKFALDAGKSMANQAMEDAKEIQRMEGMSDDELIRIARKEGILGGYLGAAPEKTRKWAKVILSRRGVAV